MGYVADLVEAASIVGRIVSGLRLKCGPGDRACWHRSAVRSKALAIGGAGFIFPVVSVSATPKKLLDRAAKARPPWRARRDAASRPRRDRRSQTQKLVAIIARAKLFVRLARGRGNSSLERTALAIRERAEKRLRR